MINKSTNELYKTEFNRNLQKTCDINKKQGLSKQNILYADKDIVVVNKPQNMLTTPGHEDKFSLATIIQKMYKIPNIENMSPHRLDLQTSGIVIFTRNMNSLREISQQFREHAVSKRYRAIVYAPLEQDSGEIDLPIGRDTLAGPPFFTIDHSKDGRSAQTTYTVIERAEHCTLIELSPKTGRTHQLRLHMAALGHPILGDFFYSPSHVFKSSDRLLLHAEGLRIKHPTTGEEMSFVAPSNFCALREYNSRLLVEQGLEGRVGA